MKEDNLQQFDDFFKEKLEENTPVPPTNNWEKVASELEGASLDGFMKNHLKEISATPNPENWNKIKKRLPLSLLLRNQLNWLSKIAAVLIIFMVAVLLLNDKTIEEKSSQKLISIVEPAKEIVKEKERPKDFVFTIEESNDKNETSASEELFLEDEDTMEELWNDLLDGDEEILAVADEETVRKSLEPLQQLPIENLEAALNKRSIITSKKINPILQDFPIILPNGKAIKEER